MSGVEDDAPPGMESPPERVNDADFRSSTDEDQDERTTEEDRRNTLVSGLTAALDALRTSDGDSGDDAEGATSRRKGDALSFGRSSLDSARFRHSGSDRDEPNSNCRVFVGGIPYRATEVELRSFFETFGTVTECKIILDKETERSKGYAFVTFSTAEEAQRVKRAPVEALMFMSKRLNIGEAVRKQHAADGRGYDRSRHAKSRPTRGFSGPFRPYGGDLQSWGAQSMMSFPFMSPVGSPGSMSPGTMSPVMGYPMLPFAAGGSAPDPSVSAAHFHAQLLQAQFAHARAFAQVHAHTTQADSAGASVPASPEMHFAGVDAHGQPVFFERRPRSMEERDTTPFDGTASDSTEVINDSENAG